MNITNLKRNKLCCILNFESELVQYLKIPKYRDTDNNYRYQTSDGIMKVSKQHSLVFSLALIQIRLAPIHDLHASDSNGTIIKFTTQASNIEYQTNFWYRSVYKKYCSIEPELCFE